MNIHLTDLWLPILIATVLCWIASGLIHMLIKYHNSDYQELSNEDEVMSAIANGSPSVGVYTIPHCKDMEAMKNPAIQEKFERGPVGMVTVFPNGMPPMGKLMAQQILHFVVGFLLVAYAASLALPIGADYLVVFRFVATVAFLCFGWAVIPYSIWYGHKWSTGVKFLIDALIYALLGAGTFAWLWPGVSG